LVKVADDREWKLYTLSEPETGEVRYVGVTHESLSTRLSVHIYKSKKENNHRATWIRSLLKRGLRPVILQVMSGAGPSWKEAEIALIAHHRSIGTRLVNATDGGEGTLGFSPSPEQRRKISENTIKHHKGRKYPPEVRARMSEAQKRRKPRTTPMPPRSKETLERMSAAQRGKKASDETRAKLREVHKDPSPELREKWRQATLSRPKEEREAFAKNRLGAKQTDKHKKRISEAMKAAWARRKANK